MEHLSKMLGSAFPSMTSNTQGDLAFRALLFSLMTGKPKLRGDGLFPPKAGVHVLEA